MPEIKLKASGKFPVQGWILGGRTAFAAERACDRMLRLLASAQSQPAKNTATPAIARRMCDQISWR